MPPNLHIITGNHLEVLVDALADLVGARLPDHALHPLQPETIVVQSKGMQRWISMAVARKNGICANIDFPFPNTFLDKTYSDVFEAATQGNFFEPHVLTFRIKALLPRMMPHKAFASIRAYLTEDTSPLKYYQLSGKIADVFDQYLVFRPEIIMAWENENRAVPSDDMDWQGILWRALRADGGALHRAELQKRLVKHLKDLSQPLIKLPPRIAVFGVSYLPIFHLQVLDALSYRIPVTLFLLNPCRHYWADIISDRQWLRIRSQTRGTAMPAETLHIERGHRLLSSWGIQGRQFFGLTHHMDAELDGLFTNNDAGTLLGRIQQDILDLIDRRKGHDGTDSFEPDGTIQVHVCHSPMREIEVLHDRILALLDGHDDIDPGDILVMTPDIGSYAPFVHAVFGKTGSRGQAAIPYTVADQSVPRESRLIDAFLRLLQLRDGRFEASQVMALLDYASIRKRFDLETSDLSRIASWIREANIRWGWDKEDRKRQNLPRFAENTWRTGLDRLILGYAMSAGQDDLIGGIVPHEGIEGSDSQILGAFICFAETLYQQLHRIPEQADLHQWSAILTTLLESMIEPDENASRDIQILRDTMEQLLIIDRHLDHTEAISFPVVRQLLDDLLSRSSFGTGFLTGGVTFCAMLPMRSIPAKVICILGMQHDAFPQDLREPGFNMITADSRPGDRSKRDDDKYLFLEALISARRCFYVSYIGRDIQDNAPKPPSVLVNELIEYLNEDLGVDIRRLVTEHPLHPFSPINFDPSHPEFFSYSAENQEASQFFATLGTSAPFFSGPLPAPPESWRTCDLDQLIRFFAHPVRFLMEQRLGIHIQESSEDLVDTEPFNLNALQLFQVNQLLLRADQEGRAPDQSYAALRAAGLLPHGRTGAAAFNDALSEVEAFSQTLDRILPQEAARDMALDIDLPPFKVSSRLTSIYSHAMVLFRFARVRPQDIMAAYLQHLALLLLSRDDFPATTLLVCKDVVWQFEPVDTPEEILQELLSLYWHGLSFPIPFFARASYEYAFKRIYQEKARAEALKEAAKMFRGGPYQRGDFEDGYIRQCFNAAEDPLTSEFESVALKVYKPVFAVGRPISPADSQRTQFKEI